MKSVNNTQILAKSIDIQLKKMLEKDLKAYRQSLVRKEGINQGNKQAA
ncbi:MULTISPECIES: hypothetical protein [unclassified Mucilaginibacter]